VRVKIPAAGKEYECGFSAEGTVAQNISLLMKLISHEISGCLQTDREWHVFDETAGRFYPPAGSAEAEGICSGSVLVLV
jgi:hypothetical protein